MATNRKCVFCGSTDLSKEHIFAQWLLKELEIYDEHVLMTHATSVGLPISNRKHPFSKLVNGLVCKKCNNGWMSQLEGDCQNHIINLMNMVEMESELSWLKENCTTMAKWAFKNIILLNSATNYRQLVPDEHYSVFFAGEIPKGVLVDMSFCTTEPTIEWRQSYGGLMVREQGMPFNNNSVRYIITFQIRNLLIKVAYYESVYNVFYEDEGVIRLFPEFGLYGEPKIFENIDSYDVHGVFYEYANKKEKL